MKKLKKILSALPSLLNTSSAVIVAICAIYTVYMIDLPQKYAEKLKNENEILVQEIELNKAKLEETVLTRNEYLINIKNTAVKSFFQSLNVELKGIQERLERAVNIRQFRKDIERKIALDNVMNEEKDSMFPDWKKYRELSNEEKEIWIYDDDDIFYRLDDKEAEQEYFKEKYGGSELIDTVNYYQFLTGEKLEFEQIFEKVFNETKFEHLSAEHEENLKKVIKKNFNRKIFKKSFYPITYKGIEDDELVKRASESLESFKNIMVEISDIQEKLLSADQAILLK